MLRRTGLPILIFLLCLSAVATPVIAAGPPGHLPRAGHTSGFLGVLWHALTSLFAAKNGSMMDPDGLTATTSTCRSESGSIMDPNGCPGIQTDSGSVMDPDG
ncbi:MAG TPA: hypothetical protein VLX28_01510 [Thermoanaerobaculia bacterium]|nr:hypothetical protein [Thermoanaerobaculia bacterium]